MGFQYTKFSSVGFSKVINEDAIDIIETEGGVLFMLCDGMGGVKGAELPAQLAIKSIKTFFCTYTDDDYLDRLKSAIAETNDFIYNRINGNAGKIRPATTIELLYLKSNTAYIAHVGDSRIYHQKNGQLRQLTKDHSLVQKLVDEGFLTMNEAEVHPDRNVVIKAIGDKGIIDADLIKLKLNEYDMNRFFICSDGVTNLINNEEIELLLKSTDCNNIISELSELIRSRGASDDYSFIYIENVR
jgi:PPM family protein phosphatase